MKKNTFESSLKRLEVVVDEMENAEIDIDKAFKLFKEGTDLVRQCSEKLEETKKKIQILVEKNGKIYKEDYNKNKTEIDDEESN